MGSMQEKLLARRDFERVVESLIELSEELLDRGEVEQAREAYVRAYMLLRSNHQDSDHIRKMISRLKNIESSFPESPDLEESLELHRVFEDVKVFLKESPGKAVEALESYLKKGKFTGREFSELRCVLNSSKLALRGESHVKSGKLILAVRDYESAGKYLVKTRMVGCLDGVVSELKNQLESKLKEAESHIRAGDDVDDFMESVEEYRQARHILKTLGVDINKININSKIFARINAALKSAEAQLREQKFSQALESLKLIKKISHDEGVDLPDLEELMEQALEGLKLYSLVKIDFKSEMRCNTEYKVAIEVFNQFDTPTEVTVDLDDAEKYFELSDGVIRFPTLKKGERLKRYITMEPLYEGEIRFSIKIVSDIVEGVQELSVRIKEPGEKVDASRYENHVKTLIARSSVRWEDIGGLSRTKKAIIRNLNLSRFKLPESIRPLQGILLYGPPGTGKSLLASAAANLLDATFFNVNASSILSHWFGESSRIVEALYTEARKKAPSIVFIDEIDSIAINRTYGDCEGGLRLLSTLLSELSGFKGEDEDRYVLTIAATNVPWNLDDAVLSRFPLQIHVPLPDVKACEEILKIHLKGLEYDLPLPGIARRCVSSSYSGRDIEALCRQAIWEMLDDMNPFLSQPGTPTNRSLRRRPLTMGDFEKAFSEIKPKANPRLLKMYEQFGQNRTRPYLVGYQ